MRHTETATIDRPAEEVWAFVGDVQAWPKWIADVTDIEVPSGEMTKNTQISYKWRGRETHPTISHYEPGRQIGLSSSESSYEFRESMTLQPMGEQKTGVSFTMGFEPTAWWTKILAILLWPFKRAMLGRPLRKELQSLKRAVESVSSEERHA